MYGSVPTAVESPATTPSPRPKKYRDPGFSLYRVYIPATIALLKQNNLILCLK